ncbi:IS3 family transposase [Paenibacillus sp. Z3-2]
MEKPQNLEQARTQIMEYISFYNKERFQNNSATSPRLNSGKKSPLNEISLFLLST